MKKYYFLAALMFTWILPSFAMAATLTLGGPSGATIGGTFNVPVYVSTQGGESANAISGTVTYPTGLVSLVAVSKAGSIVTLWPSEPSQSGGSMHFEGVILNPGYSGQGGTVITLTFQAKASGPAALVFEDASVLANDGKATPILTDASPKTIQIQGGTPSVTPQPQTSATPAPLQAGVVITSSTHPDPNKWYNKSKVQLDWSISSEASSVRIGYDKDPKGQPTIVYDVSTTHKELTLKDGTWYFHVQEKVNGAWGSVKTFKIHIDTVPPNPLNITFPHGSTTIDPRPVALFNTTDDLSGISYYNVTVNGNGLVRLASADVTSNPYAVPMQNPGTSTLKVIAYDEAGNSATAAEDFTINGLTAPKFDPVTPISVNDILQVSGLTYPNARIDVYLKDGSGAVTSQWSRTSANGAFRIIWIKHLVAGSYTITAQVTDDTGAQSYVSEPIKIQVTPPAYSLLEDIAFKYLPFSFALLTILLIVGYFANFPLLRRLIKPIGRTPAHTLLHEQFAEMRDAITKEIFAMHHAKTKRQLNDEEERFLERFEKLLAKAEKAIEKDLQNVT